MHKSDLERKILILKHDINLDKMFNQLYFSLFRLDNNIFRVLLTIEKNKGVVYVDFGDFASRKSKDGEGAHFSKLYHGFKHLTALTKTYITKLPSIYGCVCMFFFLNIRNAISPLKQMGITTFTPFLWIPLVNVLH